MPTLGNRPGAPNRLRPPGLVLAAAGVLGLALVAAAVRPPWQIVPRDFGLEQNEKPYEAPSLPSAPSGSASPPPPYDSTPFPPVPWLGVADVTTG